VEEGIRLDVNEDLFNYGFDCPLFRRRGGGLGSTAASATVDEERREEEEERAGENDRVRGETGRIMKHVLDASLRLPLFSVRAAAFSCCTRQRLSHGRIEHVYQTMFLLL
jgi:hypothetical protein